MAIKIGGLGKGLEAIFMENDLVSGENKNIKGLNTVRISNIEPNKKQPRNIFDESSISELADSIATNGIIQPLLIRPIEGGRYQIVAGERRWRAARMAGLDEVPVIIRDLDDVKVMEIALIENLQREDLTPIEEAKGYKLLMDKYGLTQEEVSHSVGKSRPAVSNAIRLLCLPEDIINMVEQGKITAGHAKALLSLGSEEKMVEKAKEVIKKALSVRELEQLVQRELKGNSVKQAIIKSKSMTIFDEIELSLRECLGRKIKVKGNSRNKGVIQIEFFGKKDLMGIAEVLSSISEN